MPIPVLLVVLVGCLPPSVAFADAPLHEQPPVRLPWIEGVLSANRDLERVPPAEHGLIARATHAPCFSIEHPVPVTHLTPLLPRFALCIGMTASADATGWAGYEALGDHARSVRNWVEAEHAYVKAIEVLDRTTVHDDNQELAALLSKMGNTRYQQKDFAGAAVAYRHALRIYTVTHAADDLRVADTLHFLALALFQQPDSRELAGALFFRAWAVREKALGSDDPTVAESLQFMALSLYPDDVANAIPLLREAMRIREKTYGYVHASVAETLTMMAVLYETHHRHDLAIRLFQEALTIQEALYGPNATETLQARENLDKAQREIGSVPEEPTPRK